MEKTLIKAPVGTITNDYDDTFKNRVKRAIEINQEKGIEMVKEIVIDSGSYRSHCLSWDKKEGICFLDFYAAARVFGFEHTIENIAGVIIL